MVLAVVLIGASTAWAADGQPATSAATAPQPATSVPSTPHDKAAAAAQDAEDPLPADMPPPGPPPPASEVDRLARTVASGLRCPVCQGMSVADSPSKTAVAMNERVHQLVAAGYSKKQIDDYFVARYGEWILLQPPTGGIAWLLWLGPAGLLGLMLVWAAGLVGRWRREPDEVPLPSDVGLAPKDPYEQKLLQELEDSQ